MTRAAYIRLVHDAYPTLSASSIAIFLTYMGHPCGAPNVRSTAYRHGLAIPGLGQSPESKTRKRILKKGQKN